MGKAIMLRICMIMFVCGTFASAAVAQDNPNSPRGRRDIGVQPPKAAPLPGQLGETVEPSRWGTLSQPAPTPQWGTLGGQGWSGVSAKPPAPPH